MKKKLYLLIILVVPCLSMSRWTLNELGAQSFPWPQNITYSYGFKPSAVSQTVMTTNARNAYLQWVTDFVTATNAGGFRRVKYPQAINFTYTASEGVVYGMLLSSYSADRT